LGHTTLQQNPRDDFSLLGQTLRQIGDQAAREFSSEGRALFSTLFTVLGAGLLSASSDEGNSLLPELASLLKTTFKDCERDSTLNFSEHFQKLLSKSSQKEVLSVYFRTRRGQDLLSLCHHALSESWSPEKVQEECVRSQYQISFHFMGSAEQETAANYARIVLGAYGLGSSSLRFYLEQTGVGNGVLQSATATGLGSSISGRVVSSLIVRMIACGVSAPIMRWGLAMLAGAASSAGQLGFQAYCATRHMSAADRLAYLENMDWDSKSAVVTGMVCGISEMLGSSLLGGGATLASRAIFAFANFSIFNVSAELASDYAMNCIGISAAYVHANQEDLLGPQTLFGKWCMGAGQEFVGAKSSHMSSVVIHQAARISTGALTAAMQSLSEVSSKEVQASNLNRESENNSRPHFSTRTEDSPFYSKLSSLSFFSRPVAALVTGFVLALGLSVLPSDALAANQTPPSAPISPPQGFNLQVLQALAGMEEQLRRRMRMRPEEQMHMAAIDDKLRASGQDYGHFRFHATSALGVTASVIRFLVENPLSSRSGKAKRTLGFGIGLANHLRANALSMGDEPILASLLGAPVHYYDVHPEVVEISKRTLRTGRLFFETFAYDLLQQGYRKGLSEVQRRGMEEDLNWLVHHLRAAGLSDPRWNGRGGLGLDVARIRDKINLAQGDVATMELDQQAWDTVLAVNVLSFLTHAENGIGLYYFALLRLLHSVAKGGVFVVSLQDEAIMQWLKSLSPKLLFQSFNLYSTDGNLYVFQVPESGLELHPAIVQRMDALETVLASERAARTSAAALPIAAPAALAVGSTTPQTNLRAKSYINLLTADQEGVFRDVSIIGNSDTFYTFMTRENHRSHLEQSRKAILEAARRVAKPSDGRRRRVLVLGAGGIFDIPVTELVRDLECDVCLVEVDEDRIAPAYAALPKDVKAHVQVRIADGTCGLIFELARKFAELKNTRHKNKQALAEAYVQILELCLRVEKENIDRANTQRPWEFFQTERPDLFVSSMLANQLCADLFDTLEPFSTYLAQREVMGEIMKENFVLAQRLRDRVLDCPRMSYRLSHRLHFQILNTYRQAGVAAYVSTENTMNRHEADGSVGRVPCVHQGPVTCSSLTDFLARMNMPGERLGGWTWNSRALSSDEKALYPPGSEFRETREVEAVWLPALAGRAVAVEGAMSVQASQADERERSLHRLIFGEDFQEFEKALKKRRALSGMDLVAEGAADTLTDKLFDARGLGALLPKAELAKMKLAAAGATHFGCLAEVFDFLKNDPRSPFYHSDRIDSGIGFGIGLQTRFSENPDAVELKFNVGDEPILVRTVLGVQELTYYDALEEVVEVAKRDANQVLFEGSVETLLMRLGQKKNTPFHVAYEKMRADLADRFEFTVGEDYNYCLFIRRENIRKSLNFKVGDVVTVAFPQKNPLVFLMNTVLCLEELFVPFTILRLLRSLKPSGVLVISYAEDSGAGLVFEALGLKPLQTFEGAAYEEGEKVYLYQMPSQGIHLPTGLLALLEQCEQMLRNHS